MRNKRKMIFHGVGKRVGEECYCTKEREREILYLLEGERVRLKGESSGEDWIRDHF